MKIDLDQIRNLLAVVSQTDITELTIESGEEKITVKKAAGAVSDNGPAQLTMSTPPQAVAAPQPVAPPPAPVKAPASNNHEPDPVAGNGLLSIDSPMVGTFYRASSPTARSFVDVGDRVSVGQTVCIIEAMKLMNDLPSEITGKIVKVLAENGTTVEFGQPLFLVDPKG